MLYHLYMCCGAWVGIRPPLRCLSMGLAVVSTWSCPLTTILPLSWRQAGQTGLWRRLSIVRVWRPWPAWILLPRVLLRIWVRKTVVCWLRFAQGAISLGMRRLILGVACARFVLCVSSLTLVTIESISVKGFLTLDLTRSLLGRLRWSPRWRCSTVCGLSTKVFGSGRLNWTGSLLIFLRLGRVIQVSFSLMVLVFFLVLQSSGGRRTHVSGCRGRVAWKFRITVSCQVHISQSKELRCGRVYERWRRIDGWRSSAIVDTLSDMRRSSGLRSCGASHWLCLMLILTFGWFFGRCSTLLSLKSAHFVGCLPMSTPLGVRGFRGSWHWAMILPIAQQEVCFRRVFIGSLPLGVSLRLILSRSDGDQLSVTFTWGLRGRLWKLNLTWLRMRHQLSLMVGLPWSNGPLWGCRLCLLVSLQALSSDLVHGLRVWGGRSRRMMRRFSTSAGSNCFGDGSGIRRGLPQFRLVINGVWSTIVRRLLRACLRLMFSWLRGGGGSLPCGGLGSCLGGVWFPVQVPERLWGLLSPWLAWLDVFRCVRRSALILLHSLLGRGGWRLWGCLPSGTCRFPASGFVTRHPSRSHYRPKWGTWAKMEIKNVVSLIFNIISLFSFLFFSTQRSTSQWLQVPASAP